MSHDRETCMLRSALLLAIRCAESLDDRVTVERLLQLHADVKRQALEADARLVAQEREP